jgi:hypothetical protein
MNLDDGISVYDLFLKRNFLFEKLNFFLLLIIFKNSTILKIPFHKFRDFDSSAFHIPQFKIHSATFLMYEKYVIKGHR